MAMYIENYVERIGSFEPLRDARDVSEQAAKSLGGNVRRLSRRELIVDLSEGPFLQAVVTEESDDDLRSARIDFKVTNPTLPLKALIMRPEEWSRSAPMPDTGRFALSRHWFDLPSSYSVSCSIVIESTEDIYTSLVDGVTCYVSKI